MKKPQRKSIKKSSKTNVKKSDRQMAVQQALQLTWELKGRLKSIQMYYLRIGAMLVRVRDERIFATLGHANIEEYAEKRLQLGRSSLYQYVNIYDWAKASHPGWLEAHPKGFIPELTDAGSLMWIDEQLKQANLGPDDRVQLEAMRKKALAGDLRQRELTEWRKKGKKVDTLRSYLSKFRSFRIRCARITGMPPEVLNSLDDAIEILKNHQQVAQSGLDLPDQGKKA